MIETTPTLSEEHLARLEQEKPTIYELTVEARDRSNAMAEKWWRFKYKPGKGGK